MTPEQIAEFVKLFRLWFRSRAWHTDACAYMRNPTREGCVCGVEELLKFFDQLGKL